MRLNALTEMQLDALCEVGSIGAGHAATALSQLVDHRVKISVPTLDLFAVTDLPNLFGGPETLVAAAYGRLLGDLEGSILFVLDRSSVLALADLLHNRDVGTTRSIGPDEEALATHTASILIAAYLASIARLTDLNLLPGRPAFAFDMVGAILETVATEIGLKADEAIVIRTEFYSDDLEEDARPIDAFLFFLPEPDSLEILLECLGVS